jgi:VWFA-related protein
MFPKFFGRSARMTPAVSKPAGGPVLALFPVFLMLLWTVAAAFPAQAQDSSQQQPPSQQPSQAPQQPPPANPNPNQQEAPPEAGGPQNDVGPYVIPKKKEEPPPPAPEKPKKIENMPDYSIKVDVPVVNLDVLVTTKDGQTVPGLLKDNFKIMEDGQQQQIATFNKTQAPITAVLLVEFASTNYGFMREALNASYAFANTLQKDDWISVISYDVKPRIMTDFTQDKRAAFGALNEMRYTPTFTETNMFDALFDTLDRIDRIEGKKYIILVSTGFDSFSKLTLDQILKKVKSTKDVTIYPISVGFAVREYCEVNHCTGYTRGGGMVPVSRMDYLQGDNEMRTFATLTGGRAYFPRFQGELPDMFHEIGADIRNQYSISYHPTNPKLDGTYRKLKVELQAADGGPLKVKDQKGKDVKYIVYAREGYTAKHTVE